MRPCALNARPHETTRLRVTGIAGSTSTVATQKSSPLYHEWIDSQPHLPDFHTSTQTVDCRVRTETSGRCRLWGGPLAIPPLTPPEQRFLL